MPGAIMPRKNYFCDFRASGHYYVREPLVFWVIGIKTFPISNNKRLEKKEINILGSWDILKTACP